MYIMRTKRKNGSDYEATPQIVEYDNTTESESVLRATRDALQRLHYACTVVIHTECSNVAAAITQHWPEKWQHDGWKSAKGEPGPLLYIKPHRTLRLHTAPIDPR